MKKDKKYVMLANPRAWLAIIVTVPLSLIPMAMIAKEFFIGPPSVESYMAGIISCAIVNVHILIFWYKRFYCFFVYDSKGIKKGKKFIPWENVCITMYDMGRSGPDREPNGECFFYLSDHYVTREEISHGEMHGGMFFMVTDKRLKRIFEYYDKQVNIICRMNRNSYLTSLVISHNLHWDKPSNTEK